MLDQEDRVVSRVITVAERVDDLEDLGAAQFYTLTRLHSQEYNKRREDTLTRISDALNGCTEFDAQVTTEIFENDLAQTDAQVTTDIFENDSPRRTTFSKMSPQATSRTTAKASSTVACSCVMSSGTTAPTPATSLKNPKASTASTSTKNMAPKKTSTRAQRAWIFA